MFNHPYFQLLRASYRFAENHRRQFVASVFCFVVAVSVTMFQPYVFGQILNVLQVGGPDMWPHFFVYLGIAAAIPLVMWLFHGVGRVLERTAAFYITKNFKGHLFGIISKLPYSWHLDNHSGSTIDRVSKSTNALENFSDSNFEYVHTLVRLAGSLIGIVVISKLLGIVTLACSVVVIWVVVLFDRRLTVQHKHIIGQDHVVASLLHDYVSNMRTIITLHFEALAKTELARKIQESFLFRRRNFVENELKWFTMQTCINMVTLAMLAIYARQSYSDSGVVLAGNLVMIYQYFERFSGSFSNFTYLYGRMVWQNNEFHAADEILASESEIRNADVHMLEQWNRVEFENLSFSYVNSDRIILNDISFSLSKGEKVALVGESGSGKSTLLAILKGLYPASVQKVKVDGRTHDSSGILAWITTLIPQDPEIFENTLEYNITFGIESDTTAVRRAVELARFDTVLARLEKGLQTDVKEKGVNLSGGERQRLALARGLFLASDREMVLLDESTSSVDPINERLIYEHIFREYPHKCIVSAIHKLHLLPFFDTIYVFENGKIAERGTLNELVAKNGTFTRMWEEYSMENPKKA